MNTICIWKAKQFLDTVPVKAGEKVFCIGVKNNNEYSLESLAASFPQLTITREKEVLNPKYIGYTTEGYLNAHILQPAWLELATSEQVPPVVAAKAASPKTTKGK